MSGNTVANVGHQRNDDGVCDQRQRQGGHDSGQGGHDSGIVHVNMQYREKGRIKFANFGSQILSLQINNYLFFCHGNQ